MEQILEKLETIIEDIGGTEELDIDEVLQELNKLKDEIEDYHLRREEGNSIDWEDLD